MTATRKHRASAVDICFALIGAGLRLGPSAAFAEAPESARVSQQSRPEAEAKAQEKSSRTRSLTDKLPLYFIENRGQVDPRVAYYVHGTNKMIYFTADGLTLVLRDASQDKRRYARLSAIVASEESSAPESTPVPQRRLALKLDFVGADARVKPRGEEPAPGLISYFVGPQAEWKTGLRTYRRVIYPDLWPGIDLVYSGTAQRLKYMFVVKPGTDPKTIQLRYRGAESVAVGAGGRLQVRTALGDFEDDKPFAYQQMDGRSIAVDVGYGLQPRPDTDSFEYGFQLGSYDPSLPLIIDPAILVYAGFIGGLGDDRGNAIAADGAGNAYITGETNSPGTSFPDGNGFGVLPGVDMLQNGGVDAFVAKVNAAGTALLYATYIGGSGDDRGNGIALQPGEAGCPPACSVYVVGETNSPQSTFPRVVGPDLTQNGGFDAFVAKLNPGGTALAYAGYIGGAGDDRGKGIVVDGAGAAYVTGEANSTELTFPIVTGPDLTQNGGIDAFVAKVNPGGTALIYAGFIGGVVDDRGNGIALQPGEPGCPPACSVYIVGESSSPEASFPDGDGFGAVPGFSQTQSGNIDAFVAKLNPAGTALVYATYLGGIGDDRGKGIAVDDTGAAYVTGETNSTQSTFPSGTGFGLVPGFDQTQNGGIDAFVAKLNATGTALVYASFIGGSGDDRGNGIAVDALQNAYVAGETDSTESSFPDGNGFGFVPGLDRTHNGGVDAFMVALNPAGTELSHATYIGGLGDDRGKGIAVDGHSDVYITGETNSTETTFPDKFGPDGTQNGGFDAFVAKICSVVCGLSVTKSDSPDPVRVGEPVTYTITATNNGPGDATNVVVTDRLPGRVVLVSATPSVGTPCVVTATIVCNLGTLTDGSSATVTIIVTTTVKGTISNTVTVDADQADPDLSDNTATERTVVTLSNLVVRTLQAVAGAIPGDLIAINDTTANSGAVAAGPSVTRFFLSTDSKFDNPGDTLLGERAIAPLAVKASSSGSTTVTIPLATALGRYFIIAVADADNSVPETQENNKRTRVLQVTRPDLRVATLRAPTKAAASASIAVQDTTSNSSLVAADASTTRFYLSADALLDGGDTLLVNSRNVPPLAAKAKSAGSTTVTIPAVAPGAYFLLAVADADGAVTESDEVNNLRARKITITP